MIYNTWRFSSAQISQSAFDSPYGFPVLPIKRRFCTVNWRLLQRADVFGAKTDPLMDKMLSICFQNLIDCRPRISRKRVFLLNCLNKISPFCLKDALHSFLQDDVIGLFFEAGYLNLSPCFHSNQLYFHTCHTFSERQ